MGMFKVKVRVANPAEPARFLEEDFWVDAGAVYSSGPEDRLAAIGVTPRRSREVALPDGRIGRRLLGEALLTIPERNETMTGVVEFAPPESPFLLGTLALASFGLEPDSATGKLKPMECIIASGGPI